MTLWLERECENAAHFRSEALTRGSFLLEGGILEGEENANPLNRCRFLPKFVIEIDQTLLNSQKK